MRAEELEPVAVLDAARERLRERRPVVDRPVGLVVEARLALDPGGHLTRERALLVGAERLVLPR